MDVNAILDLLDITVSTAVVLILIAVEMDDVRLQANVYVILATMVTNVNSNVQNVATV